MKRKIFSIFFALVLVVSFSLVTAVPAGVSANGATHTLAGSAISVLSEHLCELGAETEVAFNAEPEKLVLDGVAFDAQTNPVTIEGEVSALDLGTGWVDTAYVEIGVRPEATMDARNAGVYLIALNSLTETQVHLQDYTGGGRSGGVILIPTNSAFSYKITLLPSGTIGGTANLEVWVSDVSQGTAILPYGYASTWVENVAGAHDEDFSNAHLFYSIIADRRGVADQTYSATVGDVTINQPSPTEVWVDDDWASQADVPDLIWGYNAFQIIQNAIDAATTTAGDTVNVEAGTYAGAIVNKDVTVSGVEGGASVITSGVPYRADYGNLLTAFRPDADGAEIRNFTVNCGEGLDLGVYARGVDDVTVDSLTINTDGTVQGITNWGGSGWVITNNVITNTVASGGGGIGIFLGAMPPTQYSESTELRVCAGNLVQFNTIAATATAPTYSTPGICLSLDTRYGGYGNLDGSENVSGNQILDNIITSPGVENTVGIEVGTILGDSEDDPLRTDAEAIAAIMAAAAVHDNLVQGNSIDGAETGVYFYNVTDLTVTQNEIVNSVEEGIYAEHAHSGTVIQANDFADNAIQVLDDAQLLDIQGVLANNTFDRAVTVDHPGTSLLHTIWSSIQDGIGAASDNDTVSVAAGTYDELLTINVEGLTLLGAQAGVDPRPMSGGRSGAESIISKTYTTGTPALNPILIEASNVTINGFTISPHYEVGVGDPNGLNKDLVKQEPDSWVGTTISYNILTATGHNIVDNCDELVQLKGVTGAVIEYNYGYHEIAEESGGNAFNIADGSTDSVIRNNEAYRCGDFQYAGKWGGAIYTYESDNISVIGNKVVEGGGITFGASKATPDAAWPPMRNTGGTVEGNIVENATFGLEIFADDVTVSGNDATGCGEYALNIIGSNVTVQGNNLCNSGTGILVEDKGDFSTSGVSINYNNIYGNTFGLNNKAAAEVDATNNWWGDATGPAHASNPHGGSGAGDKVSDNVYFIPWYATATTTPDTEYVSVDHIFSSIIAYSDTIQGGIDAATAGDSVIVAAGTYTEYILIDKALTVRSIDGAEETIIDGIGFRYMVRIYSANVTFEGFTVTNPSYAGGSDATGILIQSTGAMSNVRILNNIVTQVRSETGTPSTYGATGINIGCGPLSDIVVSGNTITDIKNPEGGASDHTCGINVWDGAEGVVIANNTISDIKYNGIMLQWASNVQIAGNSITGCETGIRVEPFEGATVSDLTVNLNNISGNTWGVKVINIANNVDATYNWWGHPAGPSHELSNGKWVGKGDKVSDNVDYKPWLHKSKEKIVSKKQPSYAQSVVLDNTGDYGWNTFSAPIFLDAEADTWKELCDLADLAYSMAYRFDSDNQTFVPLTKTDDYAINPGEGFFIKMDDVGSLTILYSTEVNLIPPSRPLTAGWNLIGLANLEEMDVDDAFASIATVSGLAGYSQVVSPIGNAVPGPVLADGTIYVGESYWVYMLGERTLAGFTLTPVDWVP